MINLPVEDVLVLFHADCCDGFGAAYSAWKTYGNNAHYIAVKHGNDPPAEILDRNVIIADFAYPRAVLYEMEKKAKSIVILDHHKSAKEDLAGVEYAIFDMNRSGAGISWDVLTGLPRPLMIDCIEDRDIWKWKIPNSKEILANLDLLDKSFEEWDLFSDKLSSNEGYLEIVAKGAGIVEYKQSVIKQLSKNAKRMSICGFDVPVLNSPIHQSELGNYLSKDEPFALIWYQESTGRLLFSLRSKDGGLDVTTIAKQFGGGGHERAAGFSIQIDPKTFPQFEKHIRLN